MKKGANSLKQLERRAHLMYHRDGITDLAIGILVVLFGYGMKYDQTLIAPIYGCLGFPIWMLAKQWITEKRIGYVEFGAARKSRERKGWTVTLLAGCVFLIFGTASYAIVTGGGTGWLAGIRGYLLISMIFAVLSSGIGMVLDLARLHIYSLILLLMGILGHFLEWKPETGILLPGLLIVFTGAILLITFLLKYPAGGSESAVYDAGKEDRES